jgi:hypothetical protein
MQIHHDRRKLRLTPSIELCFLLALGLSVSTSLALANVGREYSVAGIIVNARGNIVPGASVVAVPIAGRGVAGSLHWVPADAEGRFKLKLRRGSYEIRAKDDRHGYPDPSMLLSADPSARFPTVRVEDADVDSVRVILGEQGGILHILIRDRGTGRPIAGAKAIVRDARDAEVFVELNADDHGNIQFAVPHKALVIVAEATGYSAEMFHNGEEVELSNSDNRDIVFDLTRQ